MRERHRLRALEMRVSGHDRVDLLRRAREERLPEVAERGVEGVERVEREQPKVERDLVVTAPRRVQLPRGRAEPRREHLLDRGVHVLRVRGPRERARAQLLRDRLQSRDERACILVRQDLLAAEHARVRDAPAHVVQRDALVELERRGERADPRIEPGREASFPKIGHVRLAGLEVWERASRAFRVGLPIATCRGIRKLTSVSAPHNAWVRD